VEEAKGRAGRTLRTRRALLLWTHVLFSFFFFLEELPYDVYHTDGFIGSSFFMTIVYVRRTCYFLGGA
jgi:hypothetical protein